MTTLNFSGLKNAQVVDSSFMRNNWGNLTTSIRGTLRPVIIEKRNSDRFALIDLDEYEDFLCSQNPKFLKRMEKSRDQYKKGQYVTLESLMRKVTI